MLNSFDFFSTDVSEVCSFGEELSNQSVGVFIGAAFPRTSGMRKVDFDLRLFRKEFVLCHLSSLIIRKTQSHLLWKSPHLPSKGLTYLFGGLVLQGNQKHGPCRPLHQGSQ